MTKSEVLNNIKYNENLVIQFQQKKNYLQQQIESQLSAIRQIESRIDGANEEKRKKQKSIDECVALKKKFGTLQSDFAARQNKRVVSFQRNFSKQINASFITSYINGMNSLLSGSEYKSTVSGITTAIEKVSLQIKKEQEDLNSINLRIDSFNKDIETRKRVISDLKSQIVQVNNSISYRKQRITYWKEQLKSAT